MSWTALSCYAALVAFAGSDLALAADVRCAQCGMALDPESRSTSRMVRGEKVLLFCEVGDLLAYLNSGSSSAEGAQVRDYVSGKWIDAGAAFYVHREGLRTPMGWSIVAFASRKEAEAFGAPMDLRAARAAVR